MVALDCSPLLAQGTITQYGRKAAVDKGPRALGLVQLSPKGKARIIPVAVMMDGKFYDASSYKAAPVPMALDFGIVYEGFSTGVSQGLFTITQPGQLNHTWIAEGKWLPAGSIDPSKKKKYTPPVIEDDDKDSRPVLHRRTPPEAESGSESKEQNKSKEKDNDKSGDGNKGQQTSTATGSSTSMPNTTTATAPASAPAPAETAKATPPADPSKDAPKTSAPASAAKASAPSANDEEPIGDPNRPRLRRGKPETVQHDEPFATFAPANEAVPGPSSTAAGGGTSNATAKDASPPPVILIPAISDAGGPDPRPYNYDLKPVEEAIYRNKMLELATTQLLGKSGSKPAAAKKVSASNPGRSGAAKVPSPTFDDVRLRIFDLSSSNEPVLVLSAKAQLPKAGAADVPAEPKEITLIARTNLEGELRKLFFEQTDSRHLDVVPRMELIDAVDADGDGRGELLFRRTFDDGSAYAIYRVTADRLWPLYEPTP